MSKTKKIKDIEKFDTGKMVREIARERVGKVPVTKVFKDKKSKTF